MRSASKTKKQKLQDGADCLEDEALREVAQEHLRVGGTSVKSLELLKPLEFLHGGPTPQKQLAAALSGVPWPWHWELDSASDCAFVRSSSCDIVSFCIMQVLRAAAVIRMLSSAISFSSDSEQSLCCVTFAPQDLVT